MTLDFDFCNKCKSLVQVNTKKYDDQGHVMFNNQCNNGYYLMYTSKLCVRPSACKRHGDKEEHHED